MSWLLLLLVLGAVGGVAWWWLADPAEWEVTERGIILTEDAVRGQFEVVVVFIGIGAVLCFGWAWAAGRSLRDVGWPLVPLFAVAASSAAVIAWQVGAALGPVDPRDVANPQLGDRLPAPLDVDAVAPFVMWPIFALAGLLFQAWLDHRRDDADESADPRLID